jgi:triacylglycerol lipase
MVIPTLQAPIVLVHGLLGFNEVRVGGWSLANYFPGIPELLRDAGNRVHAPSLTPTAGVVERAGQLRDFLDRHLPGEEVHVIAHSMGGLDSRYMISCLGMAGRVLSLTTLGTPHRGSAFADWGVHKLKWLVKPLLHLLGLPGQGFYDVTTDHCRAFNERVPDMPGVRYFSVAGRHDGTWLNPEWLLPYYIVLQAEGPNDGVVSVESARYGESLDVWDGDHFSLVNWPNPLGRNRGLWRDPAPRYGQILRRLADEGF